MAPLPTSISVLFGFLCIFQLAYSQGSQGGGPMKCYTCSNLADNRCGRTFNYTDDAAEKMLTTCSEKATACQKLEYNDDFMGKKTDGVIVSRGCWQPAVEGDPFQPAGCDEMYRGHACYCDADSCNGARPRLASGAAVLILAAVSVVYTSVCS